MAQWRMEGVGESCASGPLTAEERLSSLPPADCTPQATSGILIIDKPMDMTSHDVVARVRRLAGQRRVGHAGTLDPLATGVLIVCLGQATRLAEYLTAHDKGYRARIRFGQATDTYDAAGQVTAEACASLPTRHDVEGALGRFRGAISQVPPAYSAIKMGGQPLYRRARRGEVVTPQPRLVVIHHLTLTEWDPPFATLDVECSAGTYVRSLAHDLGQAVGCGAHLTGLVRTRSGRFRLEDARMLGELQGEAEGRCWCRHLLPMDAALLDRPALTLTPEESQAISFGQAIAGPASGHDDLARAYSSRGAFLAVVQYDELAELWRPKKVFSS